MSRLQIRPFSPEQCDHLDRLPKLAVLVYFETSDPGYEYEIFWGEDIHESSKDDVEVGKIIAIKCGKARTYAEVVKISGNLKELIQDFRMLVEQHQMWLDRTPPEFNVEHQNNKWVDAMGANEAMLKPQTPM